MGFFQGIFKGFFKGFFKQYSDKKYNFSTVCRFGKKVGRLRVNYRHADNTFLTSDLSSLSSKSFRFVANVDGEAQMTEAETIEEAEAAAAVFDELEVAI